MGRKEEKHPLKDILECIRSPDRRIQAGNDYALLLVGEHPTMHALQETRLKDKVQRRLGQHLNALRRKYFDAKRLASLYGLPAAEQFRQDFQTGHRSLQNISMCWTYYIEQLTLDEIRDLCTVGNRTLEKRTVQHRIMRGCKELDAIIHEEQGHQTRQAEVVPTIQQSEESTAREQAPEHDGEPQCVQPLHPILERLIKDLHGQGQFAPVKTLDLHDSVNQHSEGFDFLGIQWNSMFAFTVGVVQADGMTKEEIEAICARFAQFNDRLYKKPQGLSVPWYMHQLAFTLSGILCLVYEDDETTNVEDILDRLQRPSPAYAKGLDGMTWIQSSATSLFWAVKLPSRSIYKHQGKKPDLSNMHARWTVQHAHKIEQLLTRAL